MTTRHSDIVNANPAPQSYEMFSVGSTINMATAASDNPLILIKNPVASGYNILVWQVITGVNVTNVSAVFKIFSAPTITTNGTAYTVQKRRLGSSATSIAGAYYLPTVSASGNQLQATCFGQNTNSLPIVAEFSIIIYPGSNMLITGDPSSNNREAAITVVWTEVPV